MSDAAGCRALSYTGVVLAVRRFSHARMRRRWSRDCSFDGAPHRFTGRRPECRSIALPGPYQRARRCDRRLGRHRSHGGFLVRLQCFTGRGLMSPTSRSISENPLGLGPIWASWPCRVPLRQRSCSDWAWIRHISDSWISHSTLDQSPVSQEMLCECLHLYGPEGGCSG